MKRRRLKAEGGGCYHCISRMVGGEFLLAEEEKEVLRRMLWATAKFCGVRVLTYALMSNHFHVLVAVPEDREISDAELLERYTDFYGVGGSSFMPAPADLERAFRKDDQLAEQWRARLRARMHDVSAFMKTLKQRFSIWYNKRHGRFGTLWAERFRSVLVEDSAGALSTVAAYIDLNAVRAGIVRDPAAYRWCGYAEAMAGRPFARDGLGRLFGGGKNDWNSIVAGYRMVLFGRGSSKAGGAVDPARALNVMLSGGSVTRTEALRCRVRYFSEGAVLGSAGFVRRWGQLGGLRRRGWMEPKKMEGALWEDLNVLRAPRHQAFG